MAPPGNGEEAVLIIGEALNASIPAVGQAILARDEHFVASLAKAQVEAGANMLDVNAGVSTGDEYDALAWLIRITQQTVAVPLVLDSSNPEVLVANFDGHQGRPMLNSCSGEPHKLEILLPFIAEHDCSVIALCVGEKGVPKTAEEKFEIARMLIDQTGRVGLKPEDLYLDPGLLTIAAEPTSVQSAISAIHLIKGYQPRVNIVCAISNVSFGLPHRKLINRTVIPMLIAAGADAFIMNVSDRAAMAAIVTSETLFGRDNYCVNYLRAYREGRFSV
jgi:5-methyltetrahydrofolate--homocysteine methyltransferase